MVRRRWRPWVLVGLASLVMGVWLANTLLTTRAGIRVSREDAPIGRLPANAQNVTYYLRPPTSYYEFDTDEAGFEEWADNWGLSWERVEGQRWAIVWDHDAGQRSEVEVMDAIGYGWAHEDAGWWLIYDRRTGRAYCYGHYR